jgi:hypothetical protein
VARDQPWEQGYWSMRLSLDNNGQIFRLLSTTGKANESYC